MPDSPSPCPIDHCAECGMANVGKEFHPHALCLLVKARGGDTAKARSDMAFILRAALSRELWTESRVATFLASGGFAPDTEMPRHSVTKQLRRELEEATKRAEAAESKLSSALKEAERKAEEHGLHPMAHNAYVHMAGLLRAGEDKSLCLPSRRRGEGE